jgi:hypothetical protein
MTCVYQICICGGLRWQEINIPSFSNMYSHFQDILKLYVRNPRRFNVDIIDV